MPATIPTSDRRLQEIHHLDEPCGMPRYSSKKQWLDRAALLRRQIRVTCGMWPEPERPALDPVVTRRQEFDGYSVENVYFQSHRGFFVTGNLYRPHPLPKEKCPAILVPHGHWKEGRLVNRGAEGDSMPGLCINVALRGGIAFSYDMVGYNDSLQAPHQFGKDNADELALYGISLMGLQTFNSSRAVDFLLSLNEVDAERVAITGASGGGTQTFILAAIDERISACAPAVMVSGIMQGGCLCENAAGLRVGTNNIEIAAVAAPRPQLLISCTGDWTSNTPVHEFPQVQQIYKLFGRDAGKRVENYHQHAGHNYNRNSREALYAWLGRVWFGNDDPVFGKERAFDVDVKSLRVFPDGKPPAGKDAAALSADLKAQTTKFSVREVKDAVALKRFRAEVGDLLKLVLSVKQPEAREVLYREEVWRGAKWPRTSRLSLSRKSAGDSVHGLLLRPDGKTKKTPLTVLIRNNGMFGLLDMVSGAPGPEVEALLKRGAAVLALDCFEATPFTGRRPRVASHNSTYNRAALCERIQDILTAIAWAGGRKEFSSVDLASVAHSCGWTLLARTQARAELGQ